MKRFKLKTMFILLIPLAIGFCFFEVDTNGPYGHVRFNPGFSWWWNMVSPSGEQTGFAINKGEKRVFSIEEWNGGIFVNFNFYPYDLDHMKSGFWLKKPSIQPPPLLALPVEFALEHPPEAPPEPLAPVAPSMPESP